MADYTNVFTHKETTNWLKACIALNITKIGLTRFVDTEIQKFQQTVGPSCGQCLIENILKCPTKKICNSSKNCNFHNNPTKQPRQCPTNNCEHVKQHIISQHRFKGPSWKNTRAELWATNHWEVAKCFMPKDGYIEVSSVHDTDFNGVINVFLNCTHFDKCFSFTIAPPDPAPKCLLTQVREVGREMRHTSTCKVTDSELNEYIVKLSNLLSDPTSLANDSASTSARSNLLNLKNNQLFFNQDQLIEHMKDAQQTIVNLQNAEKRLSEEMKTVLEQINTIDQKAKEVSDQVLKERDTTLKIIESQKQAILQSLEEKANQVETSYVKVSKKSLEEITIYTRSNIVKIDERIEAVRKIADAVETKSLKIDEVSFGIGKKTQKIDHDIEIIAAHACILDKKLQEINDKTREFSERIATQRLERNKSTTKAM